MKINDKNLAAFATSSSEVDREGCLMKKGDGKGFVKRWFVLKGNLLFYFDKKGDKEPLGVIILEGSTVELAESEMEEAFCFKVTFPSKSYVLSAESQESMEQWMKSLACASYDYVKVMADELQRQLDELCKGDCEMIGADPHSSISVSDAMPTPPPRARVVKPQLQPQVRRTFESIHEEYGAKILKDQRARWSKGESARVVPPTMSSPPLSAAQQELLYF